MLGTEPRSLFMIDKHSANWATVLSLKFWWFFYCYYCCCLRWGGSHVAQDTLNSQSSYFCVQVLRIQVHVTMSDYRPSFISGCVTGMTWEQVNLVFPYCNVGYGKTLSGHFFFLSSPFSPRDSASLQCRDMDIQECFNSLLQAGQEGWTQSCKMSRNTMCGGARL